MTVVVKGLRELQRDLNTYAKDVKKQVRKELAIAAKPVQDAAVGLATANISHIGPAWSRMRIGVTNASVYVAPKSRRRGGSPRPNLGGLLMDQALQPALDQSEHQVEQALEQMLDRLGSEYGF